ncbi:MAG TPA: hypothetical protein VFQ55_17725, partial [Casimicrobiaceae bacterium]|nr:hypothetical protein [Casimicrobiaceae bacterium]
MDLPEHRRVDFQRPATKPPDRRRFGLFARRSSPAAAGYHGLFAFLPTPMTYENILTETRDRVAIITLH